MCSHILFSLQIFAISGTGSTLAVDVVPTVAITANGLKLFRISRAIISRSGLGSMQKFASVATRRTFSSPNPSAIAAFSAERCSVIHDAAKLLGQIQPLPDPIDNQCFQFCCGGTGAPGHRVHIERRSD